MTLKAQKDENNLKDLVTKSDVLSRYLGETPPEVIEHALADVPDDVLDEFITRRAKEVEFWAFTARTAKQVESWPEWKRTGFAFNEYVTEKKNEA